MKKAFQWIWLSLAIMSCSGQADLPESDVIVQNVRIVDIRSGEISKPKTLFIKDQRIVEIQEFTEPLIDGRVIDGKGQFAFPGLTEMHAHIPSPNWGDDLDDVLFLYLSQGVTTIRGMLGHPSHLELREKASRNDILSPRIFTSSPSLNGNTVRTPQEARNKVETYAREGYDFLKIHPGIRRHVFEELVKAARESGIDFAGHVPVDVGIAKALESGYASIDHVDGFIEGIVADSIEVNPNANGFFGFNFVELTDSDKIDQLIDLSRKQKVWIVPTQTLFTRWFSPTDAWTLGAEPEMKYMPKKTLENWIASKEQLMSAPNFNSEKWQVFIELRKKLILRLYQNGQGLLLGSDAPQVFNVPGFSIYHEIQAVVDCGIPLVDVLRSGTINAAEFLGGTGEFGEIINGASADFMLLEENPLTNVEAIKRNQGVMVRGQWLSRQEIDEGLNTIANKHRK